MKVLKGILSESKEYYLDAKEKIEKKLLSLPAGSIKERLISGKKYYYLQQRVRNKIVHSYLGRDKPEDLVKQIKERKVLKAELKKINEALVILKRAEGKKRG
ncbi:MAG: hypothetical protein NTY95_17635 [Bacteroidia bacterium]|nr:hypothetical protein [Bacteroidia bacterium]